MWFLTVLAAHIVLFMVLLLKNYREELTVSARAPAETVNFPTAPGTVNSIATPKPVAVSPPLSTTPSETGPAPLLSRPNATAVTEATTAHPDACYVVKSGDTLSQIAILYGTSVKAIRIANSLDSDRLAVGQKLKVHGSLVSTTSPAPAMTGSL